MLIAQGWKDGSVHVIVLSRATNGFDGWQVYSGSYNPNRGESYQTIADWACLNSSRNVVDLLYYAVVPEMMTWEDGPQQARTVQDTLLAIHAQCKEMASYVKTACGIP